MSTSNPFPDLGFDRARLDSYLRARLSDLVGLPVIEGISGGQSNPTYFVNYPGRALVLRKQPGVDLLPSAHAVDREYRVMTALARTDVPVPKTVLFEPDPGVIGTPFYVMERLAGRVYADAALPGVSPSERRAMYHSMAHVMARLHCVDWAAIGLENFGKHGAYYERQVKRWCRQWELSKAQDNPSLTRIVEWLPRHIPESTEVTICHGDLRVGNLMFHPIEPHVIGLLDWELSTLGHPLADVAYSCLVWRTLPTEYGGIRGLNLSDLGIPGEDEYLEAYRRLGGVHQTLLPFHYAFSLFRLAVIFEGISARARAGTAAAEDAANVGRLATAFAKRALEFIDGAITP